MTAWAGVYVTNPNGVPIARAGNDVNIVATRGGANSNRRVVSSTIAAGNTGNLAADDASCLDASSTAATRAAAWVCGGGHNGFTIESSQATNSPHACHRP